MTRLAVVLVIVFFLGGCGMTGDSRPMGQGAGVRHYEALAAALKDAVWCNGAAAAWQVDDSAPSGVEHVSSSEVVYRSPFYYAATSCSAHDGDFAAATKAVEKVLADHGGVADRSVAADEGTTGSNEVHWKDAYGGVVVLGSWRQTTLTVTSPPLTAE